jgi:hypothetical protein
MLNQKILVLCVITVMVISMVAIRSLNVDSPWLVGWRYRKSHVIQQTIGAGTEYQIDLLLFYADGADDCNQIYLGGGVQTSFGDVRFTTESNCLLPYWCQDYVEGDYARFWVKLEEDLTRSNVEIFIYYGNEDATSLSSQAETFIAVTDDLVMALPMDEGTGITVADYSGNGFNGTINGASWTDGRYNKALSFDGIDDYVNTSALGLNMLNSSFTFSAYVKPTYLMPNPPFASLLIVGIFPCIGMSIASVELDRFDIKGWMNGFSTNFNSRQYWGSWHHIAAVYTGFGSTDRNLYVDGVLVGTDNIGTVGDFEGVIKVGSSEYLVQPASVIDEVRIYNCTFTPTQISSMSGNYVYEDTNLVSGRIVVRKLVTPEPIHMTTGSKEENENIRLNPSLHVATTPALLLSVVFTVVKKTNSKGKPWQESVCLLNSA